MTHFNSLQPYLWVADVVQCVNFEPLLARSSNGVFLLKMYDEQVKLLGQLISGSHSLLTNQYPSMNDIQSKRQISSGHFFFLFHNPSKFMWFIV